MSTTVARTSLAHVINEAEVQGYRVFVGEIAAVATAEHAPEAWRDFIAYLNDADVSAICTGFAWWAGGWPDWWTHLEAPYFSVSPTDPAAFTGDTSNMVLIENDFAS